MSHRRGRRGRNQPRPQRRDRQRILVVTEGTLTEPDYIERLVQYYKDNGIEAQVRSLGVGKDPLQVVEAAIDRRNRDAAKDKPWDHVVCLVDYDQHTSVEAARELAASNRIILITSRIKFEIWLFWHISNSRKAHSSRELDSLVKNKKLLTPNKGIHPNFPFDRVDQAVQTALAADPNMTSGRIGPDPSSGMPILIDILRGNKPKLK